MCGVFASLGSAFTYILVASLLVTGADDDWVTTQQCKNRGRPCRVRHYQEDRDAMVLWVDYCNIDEINEDDLVGLPQIKKIYLDHNAIAHIDLGAFSHVLKLEHLSLYNNIISKLSAFPKHSCPRLVTLLLNNNQLTTLNDAETFSACTQLQILYLSNNQIRYIHPNLFNSLTELVTLYLSDNKLSFIPDQMFANNKRLRGLYLHNNRLTFLPQDFASSFKRAGDGLQGFSFNDNPWRCACLLELLADVTRAGVPYYDSWHRYDGTQPECTYSGAAPCRRHPASGMLPPLRAVAGGGR